eukprot:scaffold40973_cov20-Tisochrysis_lutea.AAC.2
MAGGAVRAAQVRVVLQLVHCLLQMLLKAFSKQACSACSHLLHFRSVLCFCLRPSCKKCDKSQANVGAPLSHQFVHALQMHACNS